MKKSTKRIFSLLSFVLVLSMLLGAFVACNKTTDDDNSGNGTSEETTTSEASTSENTDIGNNGVEIGYTVEVMSAGGRAMSGTKFDIYEGNELITYGEIGEDGKTTVSLKAGGNYQILLTNVPEGYDVKDSYSFVGTSAKIVLTSAVIDDTDLAGVTYTLGSVMRDFSVTTTDGKVFNLAEELEDKKCVMINFFYTTCSPCVEEFPFINSVANKFLDDVAVIAINPTGMPGETEEAVRQFKETYNLNLDMAKTGGDLAAAFGVSGYPTSVFIDRYGVVCLIEVGGMPSETPFTRAFDYFTHPQYVQKLFNSMEELTPIEKPNVEMPSSEEIQSAVVQGNANITFRPEEHPTDKEFAWPFIIDGDTIISSNAEKDLSFSIIYADVELKAGEALGIDYFTQTESGADILYILVNGRDIYQISGMSSDWKTCYPYVATEDGTYEVAITYVKDSDTNKGDDTVRLKNFRVISKDAIDVPTYIPRYAATNLKEDGSGYKNYASVFFNENDGYYHVHDENGPLLLANLMGDTPFSNVSINDMGYGTDETGSNGKFVYEGKNLYYEALDGAIYNLQNYANFSINGYLYGYVPVTAELYDILQICVNIAGEEDDNPLQWLQVCSYYDVYGTNEQLENPIRGLANFSAYEAVETTDPENVILNSFYYDHSVMPRGYRAKFTPAKSGVYLIKSHGNQQVDGWIFTNESPLNPVYEYKFTERIFMDENNTDVYFNDLNNVYMVVYLLEGRDYYINIALLDPTLVGGVQYSVEYLGESDTNFISASPGPFTATETPNGEFNEIIALGVSVALGEDGYYHAVNKDGSLGSLIYADLTNTTEIFSTQNLYQLVEAGAFDFRYDETDMVVIKYMEKYTKDGVFNREACEAALLSYFGADAYPEAQIKEVFNGIYHGMAGGKDYTERVREIFAAGEIKDAGETNGCILVDAELAELLQFVMDKYTFAGVETSWRKLCFYYDTIDANDAL